MMTGTRPRAQEGMARAGGWVPRRACGPPDEWHGQPLTGSEDVHREMHPLVPLLLLPVVPAVGVAEVAEDPVAAVLVAIVRTLDLRDDPLLPRIAVPAVVEAAILESIAGDLRRHVGPVEIIGPVLSLGRPDPADSGEREGQG